ncbi:unnamed protein product [Mycena citricolor]|uniref:Cyclin N-terminal domain-containing protein n=1 Tax=Mycena citricolor TaxID=2018698 RepID=A0AAD2HQ02_9AGAR|nr:unnamed protein product [Mycena citricolor]
MTASSEYDYSSWSPASSSSSSSSSPVHPASLVDPEMHSSAMLQLIDAQVSKAFVEYIAQFVTDVVSFSLTRDHPKHIEPTRGRAPRRATRLADFISLIVTRAEAEPATLLVALVYLARSRAHLSISSPHGAAERLFLGALMTASKYTQDSTPRNEHWALVSGVFGTADMGMIEREFLAVLDWELGVSEAEVVVHWAGIVGGELSDVEEEERHASSRGHGYHERLRLRHTHHRHHYRQRSVPRLEPSSPGSSCASLSPRTPAHSPSRPAPAVHQKHVAIQPSRPIQVV